jgi:hypothetical protein
MPMNRETWKIPFRDNALPNWPCPTCKTGQLELQSDTLHKYQTRYSREARNHPDWEPDWIRYTFAAVLRCNNKSCKEFITTCGSGRANEDYTFDSSGEPDHIVFDVFEPEYFSLPLDIIPIPENCPPDVAEEIRRSFNIYFTDPAAASNHIRASIENLLTTLSVKRYDRKGGKLRPLSLHRRIALYAFENKSIADRLFAIKWLGNAGSHAGEITKDDALDAYEILESVLNDLYVQHEKKIARIVSKVNKKKGPIRSKK